MNYDVNDQSKNSRTGRTHNHHLDSSRQEEGEGGQNEKEGRFHDRIGMPSGSEGFTENEMSNQHSGDKVHNTRSGRKIPRKYKLARNMVYGIRQEIDQSETNISDSDQSAIPTHTESNGNDRKIKFLTNVKNIEKLIEILNSFNFTCNFGVFEGTLMHFSIPIGLLVQIQEKIGDNFLIENECKLASKISANYLLKRKLCLDYLRIMENIPSNSNSKSDNGATSAQNEENPRSPTGRETLSKKRRNEESEEGNTKRFDSKVTPQKTQENNFHDTVKYEKLQKSIQRFRQLIASAELFSCYSPQINHFYLAGKDIYNDLIAGLGLKVDTYVTQSRSKSKSENNVIDHEPEVQFISETNKFKKSSNFSYSDVAKMNVDKPMVKNPTKKKRVKNNLKQDYRLLERSCRSLLITGFDFEVQLSNEKTIVDHFRKEFNNIVYEKISLSTGLEKIDKQNTWTEIENNLVTTVPKNITKEIKYRNKAIDSTQDIWSTPMQLEFANKRIKQKAEDFFRGLLPMFSISACFVGKSMALRKKILDYAKEKYPDVQNIVEPFNNYLAVLKTKNKKGKWSARYFLDPYDEKGCLTIQEYKDSKNLDEDWRVKKKDKVADEEQEETDIDVENPQRDGMDIDNV